MKMKMKQKHTRKEPIDIDLEALIQSHSKFFDHLIELIPSRFYQQNDDAEPKPWYQGLSRAAKASLKQQTKENLKLARKVRFDPDHQPETTKALLPNDDDEGVPNNNTEAEGGGEKSKAVTYEELRMKLRAKIESLRGNRGEKKGDNDRKRKRDAENSGEGKNFISGALAEGNVGNAGGGEEDDDDDDEEIIEYGKVSLDDEDEGKKGKGKKRKLPKAKELERAEKLREAKTENPHVAWKTAVDRAMGVKVHDNPQLIKASMKREKKMREKHAEKWKERKETQEKMKGERQKKRRDNIVGRINEKKRRKIEKREKKLMRPGFEGRKEGYITKD